MKQYTCHYKDYKEFRRQVRLTIYNLLSRTMKSRSLWVHLITDFSIET